MFKTEEKITISRLAIALVILILIIAFSAGDNPKYLEARELDKYPFTINLDSTAYVYRDSSNHFGIELGDSLSAGFNPCISIDRWNNECRFKIDLPSSKSAFTMIEDENGSRIRLPNGCLDHRFYMRSRDEFEWEIVINDTPGSGVFAFDIEADNLLFYYQEPDTFEAYKDSWDFRDDIPGSYAVYHQSVKHGIYKSGKAFHIYRPRAWDTGGDTVWCDLDIDIISRKMTITVSENFLNQAVYPVIVDPTFGCTSRGGTGVHMNANNFRHMVNYNDYQDADGEMQTAYICAYKTTPLSVCTTTVIVYSYSADLSECAKAGTSKKNEVTKYASSPDSAEWHSGSILGALADDEEYIVSWQGRESCDCLRICADYTGIWGYERREDYSDWGTNENLSGYSSNGYRYSVYVDYEQSGGPAADPYARVRRLKRSY